MMKDYAVKNYRKKDKRIQVVKATLLEAGKRSLLPLGLLLGYILASMNFYY